MERNILIPIISFNLWNKQEITNFISLYLSRLSKQRPSSEPDQPSVQSGDIEDIAALNIKAEWIQRLQEILEQLEDMTLQTRAMAESAEMKTTDEDRVRVAQYIITRILDYKLLPTEAERTAAEQMVREITPYRGFYKKPVGQRTSLINGLVHDANKTEYSENITTLHLTESEIEAQEQQREHDAGQEQVGVDGTVSYAGQTYALSQGEDGVWSLVYSSGEPVFELPGTPVALVRTADTLLVPENVDGGWNVACYVIGGHSSGITYVVDAEGNPAGGSGEIESVELDGTTLRVTAGGTTTDVALA